MEFNIESPEINPRTYGNSVHDKSGISNQCRKSGYLINDADIPICLESFFKARSTNHNADRDLYVEKKIISILEENVREYLYKLVDREDVPK